MCDVCAHHVLPVVLQVNIINVLTCTLVHAAVSCINNLMWRVSSCPEYVAVEVNTTKRTCYKLTRRLTEELRCHNQR